MPSIQAVLQEFHKVSGANDSIHHFVFAIWCSSISGSTLGAYFQLDDGTTAQCSVVMRTDGTLLLTSGGPSGAVLASWSNAMTLASTWYAFEVEVVVSNTNGGMNVRRNGSPTNDFSMGGLDTTLTANSYANRLVFSTQSAGTFYVDDVIWRSDPTDVPWVGDVRCYTRYPNSDVSTQFTRTTTPTNVVITGPVLGSTYNANVAYYARFVPTISGVATGATVNFSSSGGGSAGNVKLALFSAGSNGVIGTLLATTSEIVNPTAAIITAPFPSPVRVEKGQTYWIGINQSASATYYIANYGSTVILSGSTYASWPVSSPGGTVTSNNVPTMTVVVTPGLNADVVDDTLQDATTTYVYSSTNGHVDFYGIDAISNIPVSILAVTTRGYFTKSDAGTRNATVQLKSGGTTLQGATTTFVPGTWTWVGRVDQVDPATGAAWTAAGVNTVNIGPIVTA